MTSQHDRDSRELRALCAQRDAARAETRRIVALLDAATAERDQLRAEVEKLRKTDAEILACNYPDGEENGPTISAPDYELIGFARQLGIRDAARTTHKETE